MDDPLAGLLVDAAALLDPSRYALVAEPDPIIAAVAVRDTDLATLPAGGPALAVLVTGGAGQLAGPAGLCARRGLPLVSVTVGLRDLDDLAGNARRVVTAVDDARGSGALPDDVAVRVALPAAPAGAGWLAAADEIAAAELQAALPVSQVAASVAAAWIDALLDRETGFAAVVEEPGQAGAAGPVLALIAATAAAWDGAEHARVAALLSGSPAEDIDVASARRWCRAVVVPDAAATAADLRRRTG